MVRTKRSFARIARSTSSRDDRAPLSRSLASSSSSCVIRIRAPRCRRRRTRVAACSSSATRVPTRRCRKPCAESSACSVRRRSPGLPSTDTNTRAWRRSGDVSTAVTVTNPTLGSFSSEVIAPDKTSLTASLTRRIRSEVILVTPGRSRRQASTRFARPGGSGRRARAARCRRCPARARRAGRDRHRERRALPGVLMATSATDTCRRSRRSAFTRLSSARLPFSEPDSGKNRWTRMSTT